MTKVTKAQLIQKIARLESAQDYLVTELERLDQQLRRIGFEEGLSTMKACAQRLLVMVQSHEILED